MPTSKTSLRDTSPTTNTPPEENVTENPSHAQEGPVVTTLTTSLTEERRKKIETMLTHPEKSFTAWDISTLETLDQLVTELNNQKLSDSISATIRKIFGEIDKEISDYLFNTEYIKKLKSQTTPNEESEKFNYWKYLRIKHNKYYDTASDSYPIFLNRNDYDILHYFLQYTNQNTAVILNSLHVATKNYKSESLKALLHFLHTEKLPRNTEVTSALKDNLIPEIAQLCAGYDAEDHTPQIKDVKKAMTDALFVAIKNEDIESIEAFFARPELIDINAKEDMNGDNLLMALMKRHFGTHEERKNKILNDIFKLNIDLTTRNHSGETVFTVPYLRTDSHLENQLTTLNNKLCEQQNVGHLTDIDPQKLSELIGLRKHKFDFNNFYKKIECIDINDTGLKISLTDDKKEQTILWHELPQHFPRETLKKQKADLTNKSTQNAEEKNNPMVNLRESLLIREFFYEIAIALNKKGCNYLGNKMNCREHSPTWGLNPSTAKLFLACYYNNTESKSLDNESTIKTDFTSLKKNQNSNCLIYTSLLTYAAIENNLEKYTSLRKNNMKHDPSDLFALVISNLASQSSLPKEKPYQELNQDILREYLNDMKEYLEDIEEYLNDMENKTLKKWESFQILLAFNDALEEAASYDNLTVFQQLLRLDPKKLYINDKTPIAAEFVIKNSPLCNEEDILAAIAAIAATPTRDDTDISSKIATTEKILKQCPAIEHKIISHFLHVLPANYANPAYATTPSKKRAALFGHIIQNIPADMKAGGTITFPDDPNINKLLTLKLRMTDLKLDIDWGSKFPLRQSRIAFFNKTASLQEHLLNMATTNPNKFNQICSATSANELTIALGVHANWQPSSSAQTTSTKIFAMANTPKNKN